MYSILSRLDALDSKLDMMLEQSLDALDSKLDIIQEQTYRGRRADVVDAADIDSLVAGFQAVEASDGNMGRKNLEESKKFLGSKKLEIERLEEEKDKLEQRIITILEKLSELRGENEDKQNLKPQLSSDVISLIKHIKDLINYYSKHYSDDQAMVNTAKEAIAKLETGAYNKTEIKGKEMPDISEKHKSTIEVIKRAGQEEFDTNPPPPSWRSEIFFSDSYRFDKQFWYKQYMSSQLKSERMLKIERDLDFVRIGGNLDQLLLSYSQFASPPR